MFALKARTVVRAAIMTKLRGLWLVLVSVLLVFSPSAALAQPGYYLTPSFGLSELYNDNILYSSTDRQHDFFTRFSPGILGGYESEPLTLLAGYTFDSEVFARLSSLNSALARQDAILDVRGRPNPLLDLGLRGEYFETQTPQQIGAFGILPGTPQLFPGTIAPGAAPTVRPLPGVPGIPGVTTPGAAPAGQPVPGRVRAQRFLLDPSASYRFDPLTTGRVEYTFTKDEISGGTTTDTHLGTLGVDRRITERDTGIAEFRYQRFNFSGDGSVNAYVPMVGWEHELTALTRFKLEVGPRFSQGNVDADAIASITYTLSQGDISLAYNRYQTAVVGLATPVNTDSIALIVRYKLLPSLQLIAAPGFFRDKESLSDVKVAHVLLSAVYDFTDWLSLVGSYYYSHQKGLLPGPGADAATRSILEDQKINNNIAMLSLVAKFRTRVY